MFPSPDKTDSLDYSWELLAYSADQKEAALALTGCLISLVYSTFCWANGEDATQSPESFVVIWKCIPKFPLVVTPQCTQLPTFLALHRGIQLTAALFMVSLKMPLLYSFSFTPKPLTWFHKSLSGQVISSHMTMLIYVTSPVKHLNSLTMLT